MEIFQCDSFNNKVCQGFNFENETFKADSFKIWIEFILSLEVSCAQGYNAKKIYCSCVYILKPVLSGRNL